MKRIKKHLTNKRKAKIMKNPFELLEQTINSFIDLELEEIENELNMDIPKNEIERLEQRKLKFETLNKCEVNLELIEKITIYFENKIL